MVFPRFWASTHPTTLKSRIKLILSSCKHILFFKPRSSNDVHGFPRLDFPTIIGLLTYHFIEKTTHTQYPCSENHVELFISPSIYPNHFETKTFTMDGSDQITYRHCFKNGISTDVRFFDFFGKRTWRIIGSNHCWILFCNQVRITWD